MTHGRILLADDEPVFLDSTADLLRREGYDCVTARDGPAALAALEAGPSFDLLVTDLEMPGNADLDLVRKVAAMSGGLPIIILTGFPSVRSAVASIELPVAAYLTKPVHFDDLKQRVATAVSRYRSYQAMQSAEQRLGSWRQDLQQLPVGLVPGTSSARVGEQLLDRRAGFDALHARLAVFAGFLIAASFRKSSDVL